MTVKRSDRRRLKALARDRNAPQKHVWRAEIVLFTAEGFGTNEIMRRTGKAKTSVWRWQERFMEEGVEGLLRDKTRCVYRKLKSERSDGEAPRGLGVNESFRPDESDEKSAHPCAETDVF